MLNCKISFHSEILGRQTSCMLLLPDRVQKESFPYLILLHPAKGDYTSICRMTSIERYAENLGIAIIMPDGGLGDYSNNDVYQYEDIISKELIEKLHHFFKLSYEQKDHHIGGIGSGADGAINIYKKNRDDYNCCIAFGADKQMVHAEKAMIKKADESDDWAYYDKALQEGLVFVNENRY